MLGCYFNKKSIRVVNTLRNKANLKVIDANC